MNTMTLWRIECRSTQLSFDWAKLECGLQQHIAHAPLRLALLQRGGIQKHYIALPSCAGCIDGRCLSSCYVHLLRRLLRACCPMLSLHPVQQGLVAFPFTNLVYALPQPDASALDATLLKGWDDALLLLHWQRGRGRAPARAAAVLAVTGDDDPRAVLARYGWRAWPLAVRLGRIGRALQHPQRVLLPYTRPTTLTPTLLFPPPQEEETDSTTTDEATG